MCKENVSDTKDTYSRIQSLVLNTDLEGVLQFAVENDWVVSQSHPTVDIICKFYLAALLKHCGISQSLTV